MFEKGLIKIGDNYIAPTNRHFFCRVGEVTDKEPDKLEVLIERADTIVSPLSGVFMFQDKFKCILFGGHGSELMPVQTKYLEVIGVDLNELDSYMYMTNSEDYSLFIYDDNGLIGGVRPIGLEYDTD